MSYIANRDQGVFKTSDGCVVVGLPNEKHWDSHVIIRLKIIKNYMSKNGIKKFSYSNDWNDELEKIFNEMLNLNGNLH